MKLKNLRVNTLTNNSPGYLPQHRDGCSLSSRRLMGPVLAPRRLGRYQGGDSLEVPSEGLREGSEWTLEDDPVAAWIEGGVILCPECGENILVQNNVEEIENFNLHDYLTVVLLIFLVIGVFKIHFHVKRYEERNKNEIKELNDFFDL